MSRLVAAGRKLVSIWVCVLVNRMVSSSGDFFVTDVVSSAALDGLGTFQSCDKTSVMGPSE